MSSIEKTAYPRFPKRRKIKPAELNRSYSLQPDEVAMINRAANKEKLRFNMAIQLKTFQKLGYFVDLDDIPSEIIVYIRQSLKYHHRLSHGYDNNRSLYRHRHKIREFLNVKRWGYEEIDGKKVHQGMRLAIKFAYDASILMNNIPDIINAVIEKLLQASYELPSFYRLSRIVRHTRHSVNNKIFLETMQRIIALNQSDLFSSLLKLGVLAGNLRNFRTVFKHIFSFHSMQEHFVYYCIEINDFITRKNKVSLKMELLSNLVYAH